jgi:hypothetical protein
MAEWPIFKVNIEHIYPLDDLAAHNTNGGPCSCQPRVESGDIEGYVVKVLVIHNSFDGREAFEAKEPAREQ